MGWAQWAVDIVRRFILALARQTPVVAGPPYNVTPMLPQYAGEHLPGNAVWDGSMVEYLTEEQRAGYALLFRDGRIYDGSGNLFDTGNAATLHSDLGRAIFVMDASGDFFASRYHAVGQFHHSSLVAGGPVAAAGELQVVAGALTLFSDKSGHYRPRRRYTAQAIEHLSKSHISLGAVTFDLVGRP